MNNYGFFPITTTVFKNVERVLNDSLKTENTQYPTNIIDLFHKGYKIEIALAGFSKEDISVEVNGNKLDVNVSVPSTSFNAEIIAIPFGESLTKSIQASTFGSILPFAK